MATQYGSMIIASEMGDTFSDGLRGDMLIYTDTPQQQIRIGTDIGAASMLVVNNSNVELHGSIKAARGEASNPSYTWSSNPTTGLYNTAVGNIGFAVGGSQVAVIGSSGMNVLGSLRIDNSDGVNTLVLGGNNNNTFILASDSITSEYIQDGAITSAKLSANAIVTDKLLDYAVTSSKLSSNITLAGDPIVTGNLTVGGDLTISGSTVTIDTQNVLIEDNMITINKNAIGTPAAFLLSGVEIERGNQSNYMFAFEEATQLFKIGLSNQLQAVATRDDTLASGYPYYDASTSKLVFKAFATSDYPDNTITMSKLQFNSVSSNQIADSNITQSKLATNSVDTIHMIDNTITLSKLQINSVGSNQIADSNVTQSKLAANSVETVHILNNAVTSIKLATSMQAWTVSGASVYIGTGTDCNLKYGIGNIAPQYKLDISGEIYASGNIIAFSDRRFKTNINLIENALDKTLAVRGYTYNRIDNPGKRYTGVIAQEVMEVLPEAVESDSQGNLSVAYGNLTALLIESIHELSARVAVLEAKLHDNSM